MHNNQSKRLPHLQQGFKLSVLMDGQLGWNVTFVLSMNHQGFGTYPK